MRNSCRVVLFFMLLPISPYLFSQSPESSHAWAIAIHGGTSENEWEHMDSATASAYHDAIAKALAAGSVASVHSTRHPIALARAVMDHTPYVMMVGACTYASDRSCAVSGTGVGEYFIRLTLAREVCTLVEKGLTPQQAADRIIHSELPSLQGGEGGVCEKNETRLE
jgi:isoaspartyl peptidase/L-asparaginase-like protein (Ntn-hydrolase superfamily)